MCGRLTSSTVAPAASSAATASRTRASTPGPCRRRSTRAAARTACRGATTRPRRPRRAGASELVRDGRPARRSSRARRGPATAWSSAAASRASRANGPIWSSELGERDDPVAAHPAVRRLHADDPAQRRRLADRAAGVGPDRRAAPGTAAHAGRGAARGPARDPVEVPRVRRRPVRASAPSTSPSRTRPCSSCRG